MRYWKSRLRSAAALSFFAAAGLTTGCALSTREEVALGRQYAAEVNRQLPIVQDPALERYINLLGDRIARQGGRKLDYTFYVVNIDAVNAFALPGGFVYLNRGLIERTDNLAELAGVVAHEVAHVEERHGAEQLERVQRANLGLTLAYVLLGRAPSGVERAAIEVGGAAVFARYGRDAEREADALAVKLLPRAGIDPNGLITFFRELLAERERQPSVLEQWFSTHPLTEERIAETRELIRQQGLEDPRLIVNTEQYEAFKARLKDYPPPPPEFRAKR
ncbi:MAG: M48 family metalloprotease [Gemmatimonadetes bacterium]|nr:M48 family metalloprotease [Gemmatimonadota bacterium]